MKFPSMKYEDVRIHGISGIQKRPPE